jgi:hypothetical protein
MEMKDKTTIMEELRQALHQAMNLPGNRTANPGDMLDYQMYLQQDESLKFFVLPDEYLTGEPRSTASGNGIPVHDSPDGIIPHGIPVYDSLNDADLYAAAYRDSLHVAPAPWLDDILGDASRYSAHDMQEAANVAYAAAHPDTRLEEIELQQKIAGYIPGFAPVVPAVEWIAPMITGLAINMFIRDFQYGVIGAAMDADHEFMDKLYGMSISADDEKIRIAFLAPWEREFNGAAWKLIKGWHPRYKSGETWRQAGARHFRTVYGRTERGTRL